MGHSLAHRAAQVGIQTEYWDAFGHSQTVPEHSLRALLHAMGVEPNIDEGSLTRVPPVVLVSPDDASITLPRDEATKWRLTLENGEVREGSTAHLPGPLPLGYHRLTVLPGDAHTTLIVAPPRAYQPDAFRQGARRWGIALQLYALRSARNWGIGDFTDLIAVVRHAARLGAACIGLNPLHALFMDDPETASPYAPNSRLHLNVLYIDVEAVPDFAGHEPAASQLEEVRDTLARLRAAPLVDYAGVSACKQPFFRMLYAAFRANCLADSRSPRAAAFRAFQRDRGESLRQFAIFAVARMQDPDWRQWGDMRDPRGAAAARFAAAHLAEIEYHEYLQWEADRQLALAQEIARREGMTIGLYRDLAVGTGAGGAEAWSHQHCLVMDAHVGAPPDLLNLKGQDWGLPPFHPERLREESYRPLRDLLTANMRHGGALRIDHVLGLMRLYWIPAGAAPTEGAYVHYPWDELMAVLALESHRHRCLIIGEDLGTVPAGFSAALNAKGALSTRVFYFERDANDVFIPPERYPADAVVTVGTHDLPTFPAYWQGADIALRGTLSLWTAPDQAAHEVARRARDQRAIETLLGTGGDEAPVTGLYALLSTAPAKVLMVQIEDVAGQIEQVNVPGTSAERPNWRHRLPVDLETLMTGPVLRAIAEALAPARNDRQTGGVAGESHPLQIAPRTAPK